jgi:general L-amino acid transport system permease protein
MATVIEPGHHERIPLWRDERVLKAAAQVVSAVVVIGFVGWMIINFIEITEQRGMSLTFGFLEEPAGFPISESIIEYDPTKSFGTAFLVGLINSLRVAVLGIILATILGVIVGLARLSTNWLLSRIALVYIEFHRNIPLLVLLFLWYFAVFNRLPPIKESITLPGPIYLNQRGIYMSWPRLTETGTVFLISIISGIVIAIIAWSLLLRVQVRTGVKTYFPWVSLGILILLPVIGWVISGGSPLWLDVPELQGFNFQGGMRMAPEFTALLVGLTMYTAAFIAEVVRAGIQAVSKGQTEAARAVGLKNLQVLGLIVIPQALRVIIPPLISQFLNLTKNSSLALTIGYQEVFAVGKISINQAGRAVPVFLMVMATYLAFSLLTSTILNVYNRRIQIVER